MGNYLKQIPPAKALITSIRSIGYSFSTSVADIIDNSITAKATEINIYSDPIDSPYFCILDNGIGMNKEELLNAMIFGSNREGKIDNELDLGRFGLGLKSASLSQCRKMTVASKKNGMINAMSYDLDVIEKENDWILIELSEEDIKDLPLIKELDKNESGTLVIWQNFDKIEVLSKDFNKSFRSVVADAKKHVELVFHRFYDRINIYFNNEKIEKRDPFLINSAPRQQVGRKDSIYMDGSMIEITPYTLPFANTLTLEEKRLLGNTNISDEQGFYIYRNKRLINWGTWLHMNVRSELCKLARVKVDIPSSLDKAWSLDVKKSTAKIPDKIKEQIKASLNDSIVRSKKTTRFKGIKEQEPLEKVWNRRILRDKEVKYELNRENTVYKLLLDNLDDKNKELLESLMYQIEIGLPKYSIQNDIYDEVSITNDSENETIEELINRVIGVVKNVSKENRENILKKILEIDIYNSILDKKDEIMKRIDEDE